jgi:hypothetical protein
MHARIGSPVVELHFPDPIEQSNGAQREQREAIIPASFANASEYRRALTGALNEQVGELSGQFYLCIDVAMNVTRLWLVTLRSLPMQINAQLAEVAQHYHDVLSSLDMTEYSHSGERRTIAVPVCEHKQACVLRTVGKSKKNAVS